VKWIAAVLCILSFTIRTSGQTPSTYNYHTGHGTPSIPTTQGKPNSSPAVAIDWSYDAQQKMLTLHIVNNSNKDITAYSISISQKYADGSTDNVDGSPSASESMEDMLGAVILAKEEEGMQRDGNGTFAARPPKAS
jgi:hypothetical protein